MSSQKGEQPEYERMLTEDAADLKVIAAGMENAARQVAYLQDVIIESNKALTIAMAICDGMPSNAHKTNPDWGFQEIGELVNTEEYTDVKGYTINHEALLIVRKALEKKKNDD